MSHDAQIVHADAEQVKSGLALMEGFGDMMSGMFGSMGGMNENAIAVRLIDPENKIVEVVFNDAHKLTEIPLP